MIARRPCCWRAEIADGASHDGNCARGIREEGAFGQEGLHPLGKRVRQAAGPAGRCGPQGPVGQGWRPTAPQDHAGRRKEERRRDEALSPARASEATVRSRGRHGRCAPPWPLADRSPGSRWRLRPPTATESGVFHGPHGGGGGGGGAPTLKGGGHETGRAHVYWSRAGAPQSNKPGQRPTDPRQLLQGLGGGRHPVRPISELGLVTQFHCVG